jgi:hypothetical protein
MTEDENLAQKQLKVSVSADCSVALRSLFQMTITSIPFGDVVFSDRRRSVSASRMGLMFDLKCFICFR